MKRDYLNISSDHVQDHDHCLTESEEDLRNVLYLEILNTDEELTEAKSKLETLNKAQHKFSCDNASLSYSTTYSSLTTKSESSYNYNSERETIESKIRKLELKLMELFRLVEEGECEDEDEVYDGDEEEEEENNDDDDGDDDETVEKEENIVVKKPRV